jgi:predicted  nucleic acid-binding Zn-ribbon protein
LSKNLNKGQKIQDKVRELNTNFSGGSKDTAKGTSNAAFSIPLPWVDSGKIEIQKLVINLDFHEEVEQGRYVKTVSLENPEETLKTLAKHMENIATGAGKDTRKTASYQVNINGVSFVLKASERDAKETDAAKLMQLGNWCMRENVQIDAASNKIPSYLYLLEKPSVVFQCKGKKVELSPKEAAMEVDDYFCEELKDSNVFDRLREEIRTPLQTRTEKEATEHKELLDSIQELIDEKARQDKAELDRLEAEALEKEIGSIKTEVIEKAGRYEALMQKLGDKVELLKELRGKGTDVLVAVHGALAKGNKEEAIVLAFNVEKAELNLLKECYNNKGNLKWMRDNRSKFEATQG